jgi:putative MATE family efflux protein
MKISILIPIYNEFPTLPLVIERVLAAPLPPNCEREVIVIDDGSTDGSTELLRAQYSDSPLIRVEYSPVNAGKGSAIRAGLSHASGDIVIIQDGDLEYDPRDFPAILQPIVDGSADVVYGSRFKGRFKGMRMSNWIANRILTFSANLLYGGGLTDEATAYKAFRASVIQSIRLECTHFDFCPEVTAKVLRAGYRIHEVPISYNPRGISDGKKIGWRDGVAALWTLIHCRIAPSLGWLSMLKDSLDGQHRDFTIGSLNRAIVLLAIPMVLEMAMESLFGIVDGFFVARLGRDAVATVGFTESILALVFGVAIGLSLSTTAMVARRTGEKDSEGAAVAAVQSIALGLAVSLVVGAAGLYFAPALLGMMGASPEIVVHGSRYTALMIGSSGVIFLLFLNNAIFRGAGDPALAMRALWVANAINIVLDPCLINGWGPFPRLGVLGAAVATTTGRGIGVLYQFWMLGTKKSRVEIGRSQLRIDPVIMWRLLRVSVTGIIQFLVSTASWLGLVRIISLFGSAAVAGYTIAIRMFIFVILPSWGLSNAAAALVGQNLGAGKPERSETAVYRSGMFNMIYLGLVSIVFLTSAGALAGFFTHDPEFHRVAVECMHILAIGNISYAWGMVLVQAFNGAGDTRTPTLINLACYWMFQIPLAYTLAIYWNWGPTGVFAAIPSAETALALSSFVLFRSGAWKKKSI